MNNDVATNMTKAIEANQLMWNSGLIIFLIGSILLALYIRKINKFTLLETILAITGLKKYQHNWKMNIAHILVIIVPLFLLTYAVTSFKNT